MIVVREFFPQRRASTAVEFALVFPCFLLMLFAGLCYGVYVGTLHSVQQLAAEAARASIPGVSVQERASLAQTFISTNLASYPLLTSARTSSSVRENGAPDYSFTVSVSFDMANSFIFQFRNLLPLPPALITRSAVVRRGGF